ncbi:MAG TPA: hypothetical protein VJL58_07760 [Pyrinomonadaceae bacterium]|nr:hypothetical protein [Pyrinomonadaceae bacterium]
MCTSRLCNYSLSFARDYASCGGGSGTCAEATMKTTTTLPNTHDGNLRGASTAIQMILRNLKNQAPAGKELKFLNVVDGVMLAWVDENVAADDGIQSLEVLQLVDAPVDEVKAS